MNGSDAFPNLRNAPIVEAVFGIQARLSSNTQVEEFGESGQAVLGGDYPTFEQIGQFTHQIHFDDHSVTQSKEVEGFRFKNSDGTQIVQFRRNGFFFNRLHPYRRFEDYLPEVQRLWNHFCEIAAVEEVAAVSLHFINHIRIPEIQIKLEDYFNMGTWGSERTNEDFLVAEFLHKVQLVERQSGYRANVTLAPKPQTGDSTVRIILDINTFSNDALAPNSPDIWTVLNSLRDLKNRVFFATVTERCLELYR